MGRDELLAAADAPQQGGGEGGEAASASAAKAQAKSVTAASLPEDPGARVEALLEEILDALDLDGEIVVDEDAERISARVEGEELGLLIGRRGQTIDAVQLLCYRAAFRGRGDRKRVSVDAAGYRERRRETVERQAERAAERALESGKEIELEPMSPTERKIVHDRLKDRSGIETFSEGEDPERCVIVAPLVDDS
jgi:spoIIIJ-associated protein